MHMNTMQNKQVIIWAIVGVAVIVAGVGIFRWQKMKKTPDPSEETMSTELPAKKMAFSQFMSQGGSYECDVTQNLGGVESKGKIYLDNGKIRGDFTTKTASLDVTGSTIVRDGFSYTWSSMMPEGVKIPVESRNSTLGGGFVQTSGGTYSWNADQIGDYECKPWTPDQSVFVVPTNVTFRELETKG